MTRPTMTTMVMTLLLAAGCYESAPADVCPVDAGQPTAPAVARYELVRDRATFDEAPAACAAHGLRLAAPRTTAELARAIDACAANGNEFMCWTGAPIDADRDAMLVVAISPAAPGLALVDVDSTDYDLRVLCEVP